MEDSYNKNAVCAVTHHAVLEVAESNPKMFKSGNDVNIERVLSYMGFDIKPSLYNKNFTVKQDALIRSTQFPRKCYRTKVYQGFLRMAAKTNEDGSVGFEKHKLHHMSEIYDKVGTVQAQDVLKYIKEEDMIDLTIENFKAQ